MNLEFTGEKIPIPHTALQSCLSESTERDRQDWNALMARRTTSRRSLPQYKPGQASLIHYISHHA
jgi:hypothetical protein